MNRHTHIRSQVRLHTANIIIRLALIMVTAVVASLLVAMLSVTYDLAVAAAPAGPMSQAGATATTVGSPTVPSPVASSEAPAAQNTAQGTAATNPIPEETSQAQAVAATAAASRPTATTDTSTLPSDAAPPGTDNSSTGSTIPGGAAGSSSFPWLPVILLGAALLGGLLYLMSRRRTPAVVATGPSTGPVAGVPPYDPSTTSTSTLSTTMPEAVESPMAASTSAAPAPFVPPVAMPTTLDCPNCGVSNGFNENFCHDCGQDLRPTRASLLAAVAPPPDVVSETTPYLETIGRVDEQLEYVLSRERVLIGTAPGSDIVIDSLFQGWKTVDPTHAELRRESEGFVLVDHGSGSGTFVNEMRTGENLLSDGDVIRVGDVQFVFRVPA